MPYEHLRSAKFERPASIFFFGGFSLTFLAGAINVVMLSYYSVPVSHMSGAISRLGMDIGIRQFGDIPLIALIIGGFAVGCMLTGMIIGTNSFSSHKRYAVVLTCEAATLAAAAALLDGSAHISVILCAIACGIQNAMASSYYGLVVRTTHVTGIITDLCFMLGARLSGYRFTRWKATLLAILVAGYLIGGTVSACLMSLSPHAVAWGCCAVACMVGIGCLFFRNTSAPMEECSSGVRNDSPIDK